MSVIRTLIAAIDNAEAVDPNAEGASEVPRRRLSDDEVMSIIAAEGAELRQAADDLERGGDHVEAQRLRSLSEVVDHYVQSFDDTRT